MSVVTKSGLARYLIMLGSLFFTFLPNNLNNVQKVERDSGRKYSSVRENSPGVSTCGYVIDPLLWRQRA